MVVVQVAAFFLGAALVWGTLASAVRVMVIPRGLPSFIARAVFEVLRAVLRPLMGGRGGDYARRDRVMAAFAPIGLLVLPLVWLVLVLAGYTCMYWSLGTRTWRDAFTLSGSSLLTLGFESAHSLPTLALAFTEAATGIGLLALLISYLPTLYATFNRRELAVAMLEVRADSPPSGANLIRRYHRIEWDGGLTQVWKDWETWFADLEETHTSQAALVFFRSPQPGRSWVTAAGAVLDGAALRTSTVDAPRDPEAHLCLRAGYLALRHIASFYDIPHDSDPPPDGPISVTRHEYDEVCRELEEAGIPLKPDRDQAWRDFAGWRVNYDTVLVGLASLTMAPSALWSSDRDATFRRPPLMPRFRRPGRDAGNGDDPV
ncbi:MAG TPA: hypothetical protein VNA57_06530 [Acidimicrobiales bacterium]|nr:hypothetical protein [Acidimicrobiales bacterium]